MHLHLQVLLDMGSEPRLCPVLPQLCVAAHGREASRTPPPHCQQASKYPRLSYIHPTDTNICFVALTGINHVHMFLPRKKQKACVLKVFYSFTCHCYTVHAIAVVDVVAEEVLVVVLVLKFAPFFFAFHPILKRI